MLGKNKFRTIVISAIVSTCFSMLGNIAIAYFSYKTGTLQYEILPVSNFKRDSIQLSIVYIEILNNGSKECEDVELSIDFGSKIIANDYSIKKSSESIIIN